MVETAEDDLAGPLSTTGAGCSKMRTTLRLQGSGGGCEALDELPQF
jgi:hypothetical protein